MSTRQSGLSDGIEQLAAYGYGCEQAERKVEELCQAVVGGERDSKFSSVPVISSTAEPGQELALCVREAR